VAASPIARRMGGLELDASVGCRICVAGACVSALNLYACRPGTSTAAASNIISSNKSPASAAAVSLLICAGTEPPAPMSFWPANFGWPDVHPPRFVWGATRQDHSGARGTEARSVLCGPIRSQVQVRRGSRERATLPLVNLRPRQSGETRQALSPARNKSNQRFRSGRWVGR
jgi:hypothetical protein